ncbi:tRNA (adenine(58)-N(1))-methyltransferase non-catalytic subunit trm6 [Ceratocystis fimbriata CBS 114723]|uniref:tRNA (adenine(58)-N(1))-methyltransferase non-catalytic subunit TRM6 n=1 Tax=Ceratocystis fimbriata CBS 114723 TaxID=1035309 RepID=A0A2C5WGG0_9PEZI|nr:tRNA (adenine(58)-N(1))-methyltransferase non-catalytic subunit trm6 [Ceratocystis fimbriata CBS 114723]
MGTVVQPNQWIALCVPSGNLRVMQATPNTTISLGKYGTFPSNLIIYRPFHLTYEVQDKLDNEDFCRLRVVSAAELQADIVAEENGMEDSDLLDSNPNAIRIGGGEELSLVDTESGVEVARSNMEILDDSAAQTLSMEEIEELKKDGKEAGRDLIKKLMLSHMAIDKKTQFSLEKYKLLKTKKYIRRFQVLPLDTPQLAQFLLEEKRDASKILELRQEILALLGCWADVHYTTNENGETAEESKEKVANVIQTEDVKVEEGKADPSQIVGEKIGGGRYLVVDETGGLLVTTMAERMGILNPLAPEEILQKALAEDKPHEETSVPEKPTVDADIDAAEAEAMDVDTDMAMNNELSEKDLPEHYHKDDLEVPFAGSNTLTLVHANGQPNLSVLRFYNYDMSIPNPPYSTQPLYSRLLTINWLQLLSPEKDHVYTDTPASMSDEELAAIKASRRGTYHRKRRRWARTRYIVDSTRAGGFAGLVVASTMDPVSVLRATLPLLAPGAPVAVYSPTIEPLAALTDCFSVPRRGAWVASPPPEAVGKSVEELERWQGSEDFPINPSLLVGPSVQSSRARHWQVLPGRTHPLMTSRGGAEGYIFTGWRAVPVQGQIAARGLYKRRRTEAA